VELWFDACIQTTAVCFEVFEVTELDVRRGMPPVKLSRDEFEKRYRARFIDPAFRRDCTIQKGGGSHRSASPLEGRLPRKRSACELKPNCFPPGALRDELIRKARQAKTGSPSPELQRPA